MRSFLDVTVAILFVLFMIFVFGGYHKTKSAQREADEKKSKEKNNDSLK